MDSCTQGQGTSLVILSHSPGKFGEKPTQSELPATHPEIIQGDSESTDGLLADLTVQGIHGIHLIGEEDFIDIIGLCLEHHQMQCLSKIVKPRIDSEEDNSEWLPEQFPVLKTSERYLIAVLSHQEEIFQKLLRNGYQEQIHWISMN